MDDKSTERTNGVSVSLEGGDNLIDFVTSHFQAQQAEVGGLEEGLNEERMNRFYERAVSESQRMNSEINKSRLQRSALHAELGAERFEQWTHDHSSEVLTPQQFASWQRQERQTKEELLTKNLEKSCQNDDDSSGEDISH